MPDFDNSEQKTVTGSLKYDNNAFLDLKKFREFLEQLTDC